MTRHESPLSRAKRRSEEAAERAYVFNLWLATAFRREPVEPDQNRSA